MKFTVIWQPITETELAKLYNDAVDKPAVSNAANRIDELLRKDPLGQGESRPHEVRIMFEPPLAVLYRVIEDDMKVMVFAVWTF